MSDPVYILRKELGFSMLCESFNEIECKSKSCHEIEDCISSYAFHILAHQR